MFGNTEGQYGGIIKEQGRVRVMKDEFGETS